VKEQLEPNECVLDWAEHRRGQVCAGCAEQELGPGTRCQESHASFDFRSGERQSG